MHSSRMRTVRRSGRLGGGRGVLCLPSGVSGGGRLLCLGEVSAQGVYTPSPWTESQTGVKTLPFRNFICGQ